MSTTREIVEGKPIGSTDPTAFPPGMRYVIRSRETLGVVAACNSRETADCVLDMMKQSPLAAWGPDTYELIDTGAG